MSKAPSPSKSPRPHIVLPKSSPVYRMPLGNPFAPDVICTLDSTMALAFISKIHTDEMSFPSFPVAMSG